MGNDIFNKFHLDGRSLALKTIQNKIEQLISSGIYNDLEDFIKDNPDLENFQNHTKLNNRLTKVWGYQIADTEYLALLEELRKKSTLNQQKKQVAIQTLPSEQKVVKNIESTNTEKLQNIQRSEPIEHSLPVENQSYKQLPEQDDSIIQKSVVPEGISLGPIYNFDNVSAQKKAEMDIFPKQKTLQMRKQAGFSNALILAFITGVFLGIMFLSTCIKALLP